MSVTTSEPDLPSSAGRAPTPPTAGIDWAKDEHAVALVAPDGGRLDRWQVPHTAAGLRSLIARLVRVGVAEVGWTEHDLGADDRARLTSHVDAFLRRVPASGQCWPTATTGLAA